jgi:hypothetical protein
MTRDGNIRMIALANFPQPSTFGNEGNEAFNAFRGPGFAEWDTAFLKNTAITEGVNFQLRFEFFNLFNRANLNTVDTNLPDGNSGVRRANTPRAFCRLAATLRFEGTLDDGDSFSFQHREVYPGFATRLSPSVAAFVSARKVAIS